MNSEWSPGLTAWRNGRFTPVASQRGQIRAFDRGSVVAMDVQRRTLARSELEDDVYQVVTDEADRIEYEAWFLQAGPAMWRRFIAVAPRERRLADTMMHVARLSPESLELLMIQIMEEPADAARALKALGANSDR